MTNVLVLPNNCVATIDLMVHARDTSGNCAAWFRKVVARRGASAATTEIIDDHAVRAVPGSLASAAIAVVANATRGSVEIQSTGIAATEIDWLGRMMVLWTFR